MAADTRENAVSKPSESSKSTTSPSKETTHKPYTVPRASPSANVFSETAGLNTAGGQTKEAAFTDALRSIKFSDFQEVHQKPCVRDALMTGIGTGFGIGGLRAVLRGSMWSACNWAVGSFAFGSLLMFEFCQRRRQLEKQGMKMAVEVIDRKRAEKKKEAEEAKAARKDVKGES